ncbi:MAG: Ig-like domain-containing protein [Bacilli bacterium]|nr:Ig-like domain-containing protein [Bacilli bacterium]
MKRKTKFGAFTLALAMGAGLLVGCGSNGGGTTPVVPEKETRYVSVPQSSDYRVEGINADGYLAGATVSFTVSLLNTEKEITAVGYDSTTLTEKETGGYEFAMPDKDVRLFVNTRTVEKYVLTHTGTLQVDGDPVTFTLSLGTDPVTDDFTLEAVEGAEHVSISGDQVTGISEGDVTIAAKIDGEEVARESTTVERSAIYTLREAIDDAWENTTDFADNSKSTKTEKKYKVRAKVVFIGSVFKEKVEMLLDDGTAIIDYQVKSSADITAFTVGDVIEIEEPLQNYFGLIEMYSSDVKYVTKLDDVEITETAFTTLADGAAYDALYNSTMVNDGEHKVTPVTLQAKTKTKNRYEVVGATKGLLATTKSAIDLAFEEGATYNFKGYLLNWNSSESAQYCNFIAVKQEALAATSVTLDQEGPIELRINNETQLTYTTEPAGAGKEVTWSVEPAGVVTVENGKVTAVASGTATVTLTVDGQTDSVEVKVLAGLVPATAATLPETLALTVGDEETLTPEVTPSDTTDEAVWSVEPAGVVTVENGKVTAVASGTATVTVKYNDTVSASTTVTVKAVEGTTIDDPLTAAEAHTEGLKLKHQGTSELEYYITGTITTNTTTTGKLFAVLDDGEFTLYQFTRPSDEIMAKFEVGAKIVIKTKLYRYNSTIENPSNSGEVISIDNSKPTIIKVDGATSMLVNETKTLTATVYPASLNLTATFESLNPEVATVTSEGAVTSVAEGTAKIKVKAGELAVEHTIVVTAPLTSVAKYTFTNEKGGEATDVAKILEWFTKASGENIVSSVSEPIKIYPGANGGSGTTAWESDNMLKIGTSKAGGALTLNLTQNVKKIVITGYAWKNTLDVDVNGVQVSGALAENLATKANVEAGNVGSVEFTLGTASKALTIATTNTALVITAIEFFA